MPVALKAQWTVQAGIIPGVPEPELTKVWHYTSTDHEDAAARGNAAPVDILGPLTQPGMNTFTRYMLEANRYAQELTNPRRVNWVKCEFLWL